MSLSLREKACKALSLVSLSLGVGGGGWGGKHVKLCLNLSELKSEVESL